VRGIKNKNFTCTAYDLAPKMSRYFVNKQVFMIEYALCSSYRKPLRWPKHRAKSYVKLYAYRLSFIAAKYPANDCFTL
jgi:hypothetical protein